MDAPPPACAQVIASVERRTGGTGAFMAGLCAHLPAVTRHNALLVPSPRPENDHPIAPPTEKIIVADNFRGQPPGTETVELALDRLAAGGRCDVVHVHGLWMGVCHRAAVWARRRGVPLVISPHGMLEPAALAHRPWKKCLAWLLYQAKDLRRATARHATAEPEAATLRRRGLGQALTVLPNGVDLPPNPPASPGPAPGEPRRALFLSRLHPIKGLPMLVEAWARVRPVGWRLTIAGPDEGGHRAEIEALVRAAGLSGAVDFPGPLFGADKEEALRTASLVVLPSHSENFGIIVAEALARARPVLTTRGCPWAVLETERCGWWVPATADGLTEGLRQACLTAPDELAAMGARGRALAAGRFAWPAIARGFAELYDGLRRRP